MSSALQFLRTGVYAYTDVNQKSSADIRTVVYNTVLASQLAFQSSYNETSEGRRFLGLMSTARARAPSGYRPGQIVSLCPISFNERLRIRPVPACLRRTSMAVPPMSDTKGEDTSFAVS